MLQFYVHIMLLRQAAEVDDGVAHAAEGGVDADTGAGGDVFEVALPIVAQDNHAALLGRQHAHQLADVLAGLLLHNEVLGVVVLPFEVVHHIGAVGLVGHHGHLVVAAEVVHYQVVRDAHHPVHKLVLVLVLARVDGYDYLVERVLKDVVGRLLVFHHREDVAIHLGLIALQERLKAGCVAILIAHDQFVV